ncbi:MAG TPA: ribosome maturation factor RimP [Actinomycetes bacterium]|nr:ribosome maturation factor RimP [Actinomycetes bacterium]
MSAVADRVERALTPIVTAEGFDLEAVDVQPAGRRRLVKVLVDRDGGVTLDHIASLTSVLSATLDDTDAMGEQPYVLEVSSPGVGRPLTLPRHWRRNTTRMVTITLTDGEVVVGRIGSSDEMGVTVDEVVDQSQARTLRFADIAEAHIEVEFSRRADPQNREVATDEATEGER